MSQFTLIFDNIGTNPISIRLPSNAENKLIRLIRSHVRHNLPNAVPIYGFVLSACQNTVFRDQNNTTKNITMLLPFNKDTITEGNVLYSYNFVENYYELMGKSTLEFQFFSSNGLPNLIVLEFKIVG